MEVLDIRGDQHCTMKDTRSLHRSIVFFFVFSVSFKPLFSASEPTGCNAMHGVSVGLCYRYTALFLRLSCEIEELN